jgi:hypothetical protein
MTLFQGLQKPDPAETVFYNYLMIAFQLGYNHYLRGTLLQRSLDAVYGNSQNLLTGLIIIAAIISGTYAIFISCRILRSAGVKSAGIPAFIIWSLNWVLVAFMMLTAVKSFGIDITQTMDNLSAAENAVLILSILIAMAQAASVLTFLARMKEPYKETPSYKKIISANIAGFIFLIVSYTVVWETILYNSVSRHGTYDISTFHGSLPFTGWFFSFLLLYLPMRFSFILREIQTLKNRGLRLKLALSYIAVIVTGLSPLIKNPFN